MSKLVHRLGLIIAYFLYSFPSVLGGDRLRSFAYKSRFKYLGKNVRIGERVAIRGFQNIEIGDSTSFLSNSYLSASNDSPLIIGANCAFNHNVIIDPGPGSITIGDNVLVGPNTVLRAGDHVYENPTIPIRSQGHRGERILISDDVWIASNVVVTSGVKIGEGSVVGAGSVVTKDLPEYHLCAGIPAKPLKKR
jgi:galactoside O-acetyltransferase